MERKSNGTVVVIKFTSFESDRFLGQLLRKTGATTLKRRVKCQSRLTAKTECPLHMMDDVEETL